MKSHLGNEHPVDIQVASHAVGLPAGRGKEVAVDLVLLESPGNSFCEPVFAPQIDAGGQQTAAVTAPSPPGLDQQICDRRDIWPNQICWILVGSQCGLINLTCRCEPNQVSLLRLFHRDEHPVSW